MVVVIFLPLDVHVVNGTGEPVSGAVIELFSANRESVAKTVTQDGKARLPVVWPGRYGVLVTADGYRDFDWTVDTSRVDHHLTGLRIVLRS
ncbi:carboxypeptidase regulatory-like domain-containing protein [Candidatus Micrarchaeota archaeon]|nr:carboxypeptidase regulatory-like domain-containing protein [Candidatus Micrarchaeota archaeon]